MLNTLKENCTIYNCIHYMLSLNTTYKMMKLRVKEISEALNADIDDIISICMILDLPASSSISSLSIDEAKKIIDYYESNKYWTLVFIQ